MYNETKTINEVRTSKDFSNNYPHQFDIVFVDLPEVVGAEHMQKGYHPAVVLSSNSNNKNNSNITVIPITPRTTAHTIIMQYIERLTEQSLFFV